MEPSAWLLKEIALVHFDPMYLTKTPRAGRPLRPIHHKPTPRGPIVCSAHLFPNRGSAMVLRRLHPPPGSRLTIHVVKDVQPEDVSALPASRVFLRRHPPQGLRRVYAI